MVQKQRREFFGGFRDRETSRMSCVGAARAVTKENRRERSRPSWLPKESFETQLSAWNNDCFGSDECRRVHGERERHEPKQEYQRSNSQQLTFIMSGHDGPCGPEAFRRSRACLDPSDRLGRACTFDSFAHGFFICFMISSACLRIASFRASISLRNASFRASICANSARTSFAYRSRAVLFTSLA